MDVSPSILLVDDEITNFDVVEALLMTDGYQMHYAANGVQALEFLKLSQPDVILLDVMMPGMDGLEVCHRIKAHPEWHSIPIIMCTALTAKEDLARCMQAGADDFISKPVNGTELRARVRSMLRIKQQYDDLQILLELREDMVNMMVHDLRNPLASIILITEILRLEDLPHEKREQQIEHLAIAGQQLQSQIDSLLMLAKLESKKLSLQLTDLDLAALCKSALSDFEMLAAHKNVQFISRLPDPGGSIHVDASVFRRIMDNLLSNAIKFSPRNSEIVVKASYLEPQGAEVQIIDYGPGVSDDLKENIFCKFETGRVVQGVSQIGLGLAFCKLAIEEHGGTISVASNHPKGTVFTITLPGS